MTENLVVCSTCGTINRLPLSRPALDAKCGKCKAKVFAGHPEDVAAEIFDRQIARSTSPVLVDVWAPWCGPCRMMAPAYEAAARELEPQVRLIKLNSMPSSRLPLGTAFKGSRRLSFSTKAERLHAHPARCLRPRLCDGCATA